MISFTFIFLVMSQIAKLSVSGSLRLNLHEVVSGYVEIENLPSLTKEDIDGSLIV